MPAPDMKWYQTDDLTPSGVLTFTPTAGTPTAAQTEHLWNDLGGVLSSDTARNIQFLAFARNAGGTDWKTDHSILVAGGLEVRLVGQAGSGIAAQTTSWVKLGPNTTLSVKAIPSNCARYVQIRINAPANYGTGDVEILLRPLRDAPVTNLGSGFVPAGLVGVCHGVGDPTFSALLEGGNLTASGSPDEFVNMDTTTWIHRGVPYCLLEDAYEVTDVDSASETLDPGESVWKALTLGEGTLTQTAGLKGTAPLDVAERPELPEDEPFVGYVEREEDATIETGDIYQEDLLYGWFAQVSSALSLLVTIHPGIGLLGGVKVEIEGSSPTTLTASETNTVYLNPAGSLSVTITGGDPDDEQSLPLWRFTTDGTGVTAVEDLRTFTGRPFVDVDFRWDGNVVDATERHAALSGPSRYFLLPLFGLAFTVDSNGTTGTTRLDVQVSDAGGSWTSLFPGGTDEMPQIAENLATCRHDGARPQSFEVPRLGRLKALVEEATTTPATNGALRARLVAA